jgi:hypothetical protein
VRLPTSVEKSVIHWFADRVDELRRRQLLSDLEKAQAEVLPTDGGTAVRFHVDGYVRPPYLGERAVPIDAIVLDADGAKLSVVVSEDENGRLYELQLVRYERGPIIEPDWTTLRELDRKEMIDLERPESHND